MNLGPGRPSDSWAHRAAEGLVVPVAEEAKVRAKTIVSTDV